MRVVADSALGGPEHARVLDSVGREDLDVPFVPPDGHGHHHRPFGIAQPLGDRLVDVRVGNRLLELRQRGSEERRVPFQSAFVGHQLFDVSHGRSLGLEPCGDAGILTAPGWRNW